MPVPEEHTPPTQVRVTDKSDFRQAGLPAELGDTPYRDDADVIGVAGTTDAGTPVPEGHTPPSRPAPRSPRTASAIPGDVLPTGDEDITSGAVSEHDQAIIDRKRELRGGVDFEGSADRLDEQGSPEASRPPSSRTASAIPGDILPTGDEDVTSGAVETTPEGYEQHPSGLLVPTASAIPGDVKPTGDEDVTSGAVREQAMRTRAFGGAIAGIATNVGGGLRNFGYTQLHNTAVGIGQVFGYPHQAAWAAHDKVTGQTSDEEAPSRSFEQLGTIVEALPEAGGIFGAARGAATGAVMAGPLAPWGAIAGGYAGYRLGEKGGEQAEKVAENIPIVRDIPLLSLVPGQDLAKASEDFRIEGGEWFDVAATPLDVVPIKLGMGLSIARQTYRSVAPTQVGGGFISLTSPGNKVPRLFGSEMDEALHATSIDVRRQLATKGDAEFTIGGDTFKIDQTRLDEAIRKVNLNRHLSATGATDVSTFEKGGPVPTLNLPSGRVKPPEDQFQFRTLGGTGIEDFADTSAFGFKGGKHAGMVVYGDDWGDLVIPGFKGKDKYYGGWELEGGVPTEWHRGRNTGFTPGETAPVRRVTGIGDGKGLYLDETLVSPSYTGRVHANVLAVVDKAKHPFAASTGPGAFVRRATPDEIAQARFGKNFDELDDGVGPGRDDGVGRGRGRDDGVGPGRDDGVGPGRDDGVGPGAR